MELTFNKGINKIIEEYCCYPQKFHSELLTKTYEVFKDTIWYWDYNNYFINIQTRSSYGDSRCRYMNLNGSWRIYIT